MLDIKDLKPCNNSVITEIILEDKIIGDVNFGNNAKNLNKNNVEYYYAKLLSFGKKSLDVEECPELEKFVPEAQNFGVIFSQFAGFHVPVEKSLVKVIPANQIVALFEDYKDMSPETIKPTANRILVEIIEDSAIQSGIYIENPDPREALTQKGKVVACATNATQYTPGTIVYFEPYAGNLILNEGNLKLKTLNSFDILFTTEK
jgi:co-chaperonin GroES (HSP10)